MSPLLFLAATHGDEPLSVDVLKSLSQEYSNFDWIIANEPALKIGKRFYEQDLNRSAPGDLNSDRFEARRAAEIINLSKQYQYTIDIHGCNKDTGVFLIITNVTKANLRLASLFNTPRIVLLTSIHCPEQRGAPSEYFHCGLEIECGNHENPNIKTQLYDTLIDFLTHYKERENNDWQSRLQQKEFFSLVDSIKKTDCPDPSVLAEFQETTINGQPVIPLFIGTYDYENILGYKLKKITPAEALAMEGSFFIHRPT